MKKMPLVIPDAIIKEIAETLDMGMVCYYHKQTGELESHPNEMMDEELWQDVIDKVEENEEDYLQFEPMESHESFRIIEDFIREIPDESIQQQFYEVIQRRKPFQEFKNLLPDYPDLRQQWFAYKEQRHIEYVKDQVAFYNGEIRDVE